METHESIHPLVHRIIESAGDTTQSFGLGRIIGRVYTLLYFSPEPLNLDQVQERLAISRGSASINLNQLQDWDAIRKVRVDHDRKEHFVAVHSFGRILKTAVADKAAPPLEHHATVLESIEAATAAETTNPTGNDDDLEFVRERLARLHQFHDRIRRTWENPLVQRLLQ